MLSMELELELTVVGALLSIGRPAELSELRAASIRLGVPDVQVEALCELPASPLRLSGGLVTFSDQALSFFQQVVSRFSFGGDRVAPVLSGNEEMRADEAEMAFVKETGKAARDNVLGSQLCLKATNALQPTYPGREGMQADHGVAFAEDVSPILKNVTVPAHVPQLVLLQTGKEAQDNIFSSQLCGKTPDSLQLTYPGYEGMQADHGVAFAEETGKEAQVNFLSSQHCGKTTDSLQLTYPGNEGMQADCKAVEIGEKAGDNVLTSQLYGVTPYVLQLTYKDPQAKDEPLAKAMVAVTTSVFSSKRLRPTADEVPPSFENYKVEGLEGSGGYSVVYKAIRLRDDHVFAIKCPLSDHQRGHVENEIRMLNLLGGKHGIVALEDIIRHFNGTYLVLEYIKHDKTEALKEEMTVDEIRSYGFSLFKALNYMHQKNIMHRDVKPANFLFNRKERVGRLIDFNLAAVAEPVKAPKSSLIQHPHSVKRPFPEEAALSNKTAKLAHKTAKLAREPMPTLGRRKLLEHLDKTVANSEGWCPAVAKTQVSSQEVISAKKGPRKAIAVGTRGYNAPEVLLKSSRQTVQVDVWSAGVTLWQLATEELPFSSAGKDQILREIARMRGIEPLRELAKKHSCVLDLSEELLNLDLKGKRMEEYAVNCPTRKDGLTASFFDLLERCLQVDPERRITARDAMRHKFFSPCLRNS